MSDRGNYETFKMLQHSNRSIIRCTIVRRKTKAYVYTTDSGAVYLFQNAKDGAHPPDVSPNDYGYKYSWIFDADVHNVEFVKRFNEEEMFKSLDELLK